MKKLLTLPLFCWLLATSAWAQTTVTIGTGTTSSVFTAGPVGVGNATDIARFSRHISIYKASELIAGGVTSGNLQKIRWYKEDAFGYTANNAEFKIYVKQIADPDFKVNPVTWASEVAGATLVYSSNTQNLNPAAGWQEFVLNTPFNWNGTSNLEIFVDFFRPGNASGAIAWRYTAATNANAISAAVSAPPAVNRNSDRPNIQMDFTPAVPNDISIAAITSPTSPVPPGVSQPIIVTLKNTGANTVTTATISWKIDNGAFTNYSWTGNLAPQQSVQVTIGNYTFTQGTYTVTAKTSLPNGVADASPANDEKTISVVACNALSGNYTINKAGTTSGTNFKTFADVAQRLGQCGISGPTTFSVVAGSGPYNEQVILSTIPGTSATSRVTFEGNGNTVTSVTNSNEAIVKLDGSAYVKFNNFKLRVEPASTAGLVVYMLNNANFNTISNSNLAISTSAIATTLTGVYIKGSAGNLIENDTIIGGNHAVNVEDVANGTTTINNLFQNNVIQDTYQYNFYINNATGTQIVGNNMSRPTRANGSAFYGVYLLGTTTKSIVSKNRIHNTHDAASVLTGGVYGIAINADAPVGSENIIKNNLLYNINNTTGTIYGIYNIGGDGAHIFHNTLALDDANHTGINYGIYIGGVVNNKINNNIITLNGAGPTAKYALNFVISTATIECNNNDLYIFPGATGCFTGFFLSAKTTLADWKTANNNLYDQNSVAVNPGFENRAGGNLKPTSFFVNNIGKPLSAVTDDITGANRNATTPDLGAYEFTPPAKDLGATAIISPNSGCGLTNQETVIITVTNMGTDPQSNIQVQFSTDGGVTWSTTEVIAGPISPGQSIDYTFSAKANLSAVGTFNFLARTQVAGDAIPTNDTFTKVVDALPTITAYPYNEGFENGDGGWKASGVFSSWGLGTPIKPVINSAGSGTKSWVTSLTGTYNINEQSQVLSPCLNFTSLQKPLLEMKVWWSSQTSFDGAVLQSSTDNGVTWVNIGAVGDGNNWYNDNSINGGPGGQSIGTISTAEGWSGTAAASSNTWVTVKHALTGLQLKPNVRLRVAFGADASTQNDGFAFDDVKIYDTPQSDVGVIGINQLASGCGLSTTESITVTVRNFGLAPQSNIPVTYSLDGVTFVPNEIIAGTLAPNATVAYTFTAKANLSTAGVYNFTACTRLPGDGDPSNDCRSQEVRSVPTITTYPYFQDFETNDGGWIASGTNSSWALGMPAKAVIKGAASGTKAFVTSLTGLYNNTETSVVLGPCFNFSSLTSPMIDMKVWWHAEFSMDGAVLQASTDNGGTWSNVGFNGDPNNWYNDGTINAGPGGQPVATAEGWTGNQTTTASNGWVRARHALTGLAGQANVKLRIAFASNASTVHDGFAFDDILIYERPANDAAVTGITPFTNGCGISNQETVTIKVENAGTNALAGVPVNFKVDNGAYLSSPETTPAIPAGTTITYTFIAKADLSTAGDHKITATTQLSGDQVPQNDASFTEQSTIPTVATLPYRQNFENGDGGWKASGTFSSWALGKPAKAVINSAASGNNSWVTSLAGLYNPGENSQVLSPCFNFSNIVDPVFQMKAWWQAQASYDGAVLQSSIDNGLTWQNVGATNDPNSLNWFNDNTINAGPGGQTPATANGWTGATAATSPPTSGGWVTVRHSLTGLAGKSNVKLRIAFAADPGTQNDGFAFDDILIEDVTNNIAVTAFKPLVKVCGFSSNEPVEVTLANLSGAPVPSGISLQYTVSLNGNVIHTSPVEPYTSALAANASVQFAFPVGANLSQPGSYVISVTATRASDLDLTNNTITYAVANSLLTTLPQGFNFETNGQGLSALRIVSGTQAVITENVAASSPLALGSTKGIVMDAASGSSWMLPILNIDPWTNNLSNKAGIYMCLPAQAASDSLWLMFDLKQTFKDAAANTNFRVTVNGNMVGTTKRPPVDGTPDVWKTVKINLTQFKNQPVQVGLESSTKEAYQNGTGTANLVDNVIVRSRFVTGSKEDVLLGQLSVFPNPSNGQFNVSLPAGKTYELEVVDLTGRLLKKQAAKGGNTMLNMEGTSQGIYLLKVKSEKGAAVRKLVIE